MPASILQGIFEVVLQAILEVACYYVGRVVVPVVSFGRWKCERLTSNVPRRKLRVAGLYHMRGDGIYLTAEATRLVGVLTMVLVVGGGVLIWYLSR